MGGKSGKSSGGGTQTVQQKADPWAPAQPYLTGDGGRVGVLPEAENLYKSLSSSYYPNTGVADLNAEQLQGFGSMLGQQGNYQTAADRVSKIADSVAFNTPNATLANRADTVSSPGVDYKTALNRSLSGSVDNPYLKGMYDAGMRGINQQYNEQVLPNIRSGAMGAGQYGGSRQGIAEGIAARGLTATSSDFANQLYGNAYESAQGRAANAGLALSGQDASTQLANAQMQNQQALANAQMENNYNLQRNNQALSAAGLYGNAAGLGTQGAQIPLNVGNALQTQYQNQLNDSKQGWDYNQQAPWNDFKNYSNAVTQASGLGSSGSSTSTMPRTSSNPVAGALGGAMSGMSAFNMLNDAALLGTSPVSWPFMVGGGLLGGLF